ncbi:hypothetical protein [Streptomyces griseoaurantiacus]|uniref:hypothetical protein n=1 Tax=Streptomyces griseoaurantiacus TaxID=68213 RepID=UPI003695BD7D
MTSIITGISHPYWTQLGNKARAARTAMGKSQSQIALATGLSVREYACLESGFVPPDVHDALRHTDLDLFDYALNWPLGTARARVTEALNAAAHPATPPPVLHDGPLATLDRSTYPKSAWVRLGKAVSTARTSEGLTRNQLAYALKSSSKTILRLEAGRVYGDPRTAPPGDYNSERYMLRRLTRLEMFLGWQTGWAREILEGRNEATVSPAA